MAICILRHLLAVEQGASMSRDFAEDALVLIGSSFETAPAARIHAEPVFEGPLSEALRYAVERVPEEQKLQCTVQTLTGDVYDYAASEALYHAQKLGPKRR